MMQKRRKKMNITDKLSNLTLNHGNDFDLLIALMVDAGYANYEDGVLEFLTPEENMEISQ